MTRFHALYIADMAFDMLDSMSDLIDPATGKSMRIRVGEWLLCSSGNILMNTVSIVFVCSKEFIQELLWLELWA